MRWPRPTSCSAAARTPAAWSHSTALSPDGCGTSRSISTTGRRRRSSSASVGSWPSSASDSSRPSTRRWRSSRMWARSSSGRPSEFVEQHAVAALAQRDLGAERDLGEERARDVAHDEADGRGRAAAQPLRQQVGLVAELGGGAHDALAQLRRYRRVVGQRPRRRRHGDARAAGDVAQRGAGAAARGHAIRPVRRPGVRRPRVHVVWQRFEDTAVRRLRALARDRPARSVAERVLVCVGNDPRRRLTAVGGVGIFAARESFPGERRVDAGPPSGRCWRGSDERDYPGRTRRPAPRRSALVRCSSRSSCAPSPRRAATTTRATRRAPRARPASAGRRAPSTTPSRRPRASSREAESAASEVDGRRHRRPEATDTAAGGRPTRPRRPPTRPLPRTGPSRRGAHGQRRLLADPEGRQHVPARRPHQAEGRRQEAVQLRPVDPVDVHPGLLAAVRRPASRPRRTRPRRSTAATSASS